MNYQTTTQAAQYMYETIQKVDPTSEILDQKIIKEILQEEILDRLELELEESDIITLENNKADENFFDTYVAKKYDDYEDILTDVVNDILTDYILDESKE
ncbi:MAG: hypothetical protein WCL02_02660 [bacterium]